MGCSLWYCSKELASKGDCTESSSLGPALTVLEVSLGSQASFRLFKIPNIIPGYLLQWLGLSPSCSCSSDDTFEGTVPCQTSFRDTGSCWKCTKLSVWYWLNTNCYQKVAFLSISLALCNYLWRNNVCQSASPFKSKCRSAALRMMRSAHTHCVIIMTSGQLHYFN